MLAFVEELLARDLVVLVHRVDGDFFERDALAGRLGSDVEGEVNDELIWIRAGEERAGDDNEPGCLQLAQLGENSIEVRFAAGIEDMELQSKGTSRRLHLLCVGRGYSGIGWIDEQGYDGLTRAAPSVAAELSRLALFLATPGARHITGQTLHASAGLLAHFG